MQRQRKQSRVALLAAAMLLFVGAGLRAAEPVGGSLEAFAERLAGGESLAWDDRWGYLPAVLDGLAIDPDSQTLVFSNTSFQPRRISPSRPRAIYFNDIAYVGWVRDSDLIELCAADPRDGAVFYTLEPGRDGDPAAGPPQPVLTRQGIRCRGCHDSMRTQGQPGFLMRSIMPTAAGRFVRGGPTFVTDHDSPFAERFGGWYVTGTHGGMRHLGNGVYPASTLADQFDVEAGANRTVLPAVVDAAAYLRPGSDLMALMVLAHETQMHNHITRVATAARRLTAGEPGAEDGLTRGVEKLVRYLLFADEPRLESPIAGTTGYAETFAARGPHDAAGRSLRQFDGGQYLFRYPCSFLIHSPAFAGLPAAAKAAIGRRLREILLEHVAADPPLERPTADERKAVAEILAATEPAFWNQYVLQVPASEKSIIP